VIGCQAAHVIGRDPVFAGVGKARLVASKKLLLFPRPFGRCLLLLLITTDFDHESLRSSLHTWPLPPT
jgi:hypothetical protein